jgi:hypothetical protein
MDVPQRGLSIKMKIFRKGIVVMSMLYRISKILVSKTGIANEPIKDAQTEPLTGDQIDQIITELEKELQSSVHRSQDRTTA